MNTFIRKIRAEPKDADESIRRNGEGLIRKIRAELKDADESIRRNGVGLIVFMKRVVK